MHERHRIERAREGHDGADDEEGRCDELDTDQSPRAARVVRHRAAGFEVLVVDEEESERRDDVDAGDLDEDRQARACARRSEPTVASVFHPPQHREDRERREEEVVPGRHTGEVVRHAPDQREYRERTGQQRRSRPAGDGVERGNEREAEPQKHPAYRRQPDAEERESGGMEIAQAAGVELVEVAMRELAVEHALRALGEDALVVRNPPALDEAREICGGEHPDEGQYDEIVLVPTRGRHRRPYHRTPSAVTSRSRVPRLRTPARVLRAPCRTRPAIIPPFFRYEPRTAAAAFRPADPFAHGAVSDAGERWSLKTRSAFAPRKSSRVSASSDNDSRSARALSGVTIG